MAQHGQDSFTDRALQLKKQPADIPNQERTDNYCQI